MAKKGWEKNNTTFFYRRTSSSATLRPPTTQLLSSPAATTSKTLKGRSSPVIPTCINKQRPPEESLKLLPENFRVPEIVFTPQMKCHFDRLSALVKGHLTRRLLKTEKVQRIIRCQSFEYFTTHASAI